MIALSLSIVTLVLMVAVFAGLRRLTTAVAGVQQSLDELASGAATVEDLKGAVAAALDPTPEPEPEPAPVSRVPPVLRTRSVVKAMALGTGTAHAARRLRNGKAS